MQYRNFGNTGVQVSEIGYGTWAMGAMWGPRDDARAVATLRQGVEQGIDFIDTAWVYGQGHAEALIAQAFPRRAERPFIATKCPPQNLAWPAKGGANETFPAAHLLAMTEKSLEKLRSDHVDLQQLHVWRNEWLHEGDWLEAVQKLKQTGKIRFFGISINDHQADSALEAVASGLIDSVQVIFNLFDQSARVRLFPLCLEKKVGVIVRVPLDEGGLSGTLTPNTQFHPKDWRRLYFQGERLRETCERAAEFNFLIRGEIKSLAQAALKFCLAEQAVSTVIVGMRQPQHLEENIVVSDFSEFSSEELKRAYALAWPRNFYPSHGG